MGKDKRNSVGPIDSSIQIGDRVEYFDSGYLMVTPNLTGHMGVLEKKMDGRNWVVRFDKAYGIPNASHGCFPWNLRKIATRTNRCKDYVDKWVQCLEESGHKVEFATSCFITTCHVTKRIIPKDCNADFSATSNYGTAYRNLGDKNDEWVGKAIALTRALAHNVEEWMMKPDDAPEQPKKKAIKYVFNGDKYIAHRLKTNPPVDVEGLKEMMGLSNGKFEVHEQYLITPEEWYDAVEVDAE